MPKFTPLVAPRNSCSLLYNTTKWISLNSGNGQGVTTAVKLGLGGKGGELPLQPSLRQPSFTLEGYGDTTAASWGQVGLGQIPPVILAYKHAFLNSLEMIWALKLIGCVIVINEVP